MARKVDPTQPEHESPPQGAEISPYPGNLLNYTNLPDKQAYIDLITAEIFNQNRAGLRALTTELGVNLKGNCYDLNDRISKVITPDGKLVLPETVFSVGKENADFDTIQAAVDSITDASASKIYTIRIYPGLYEESIVMKPYICLKGIGLPPMSHDGSFYLMPIIAPPSGSCIKTTSAGNYYFDNIKLSPPNMFAFGFQSGYSANVKINFANGIIYSSNHTVPLLAESARWEFNFRNSVIAAQNNAKPLIYAENPAMTAYSFKAVNSFIRGTIEIAEVDIEEFYFYLNKSHFNGKIICNNMMSCAELIYSIWTNHNASLADIPGDINSYIRALFSQFRQSGTGTIFDISTGTDKPIIDFYQCLLSETPSSDFTFNNTDRSNSICSCSIFSDELF